MEVLVQAAIYQTTDNGGNTLEIWGTFGNFSIASEFEKFTLNKNLYHREGSIGLDKMAGFPFITLDEDNDMNVNLNCGVINEGG